MLHRLLDATQEIAEACLVPVKSVPDLINDSESKLFLVVENQKTQAQSLADLVPVEEQKIEALFERRHPISLMASSSLFLLTLLQSNINAPMVRPMAFYHVQEMV